MLVSRFKTGLPDGALAPELLDGIVGGTNGNSRPKQEHDVAVALSMTEVAESHDAPAQHGAGGPHAEHDGMGGRQPVGNAVAHEGAGGDPIEPARGRSDTVSTIGPYFGQAGRVSIASDGERPRTDTVNTFMADVAHDGQDAILQDGSRPRFDTSSTFAADDHGGRNSIVDTFPDLDRPRTDSESTVVLDQHDRLVGMHDDELVRDRSDTQSSHPDVDDAHGRDRVDTFSAEQLMDADPADGPRERSNAIDRPEAHEHGDAEAPKKGEHENAGEEKDASHEKDGDHDRDGQQEKPSNAATVKQDLIKGTKQAAADLGRQVADQLVQNQAKEQGTYHEGEHKFAEQAKDVQETVVDGVHVTTTSLSGGGASTGGAAYHTGAGAGANGHIEGQYTLGKNQSTVSVHETADGTQTDTSTVKVLDATAQASGSAFYNGTGAQASVLAAASVTIAGYSDVTKTLAVDGTWTSDEFRLGLVATAAGNAAVRLGFDGISAKAAAQAEIKASLGGTHSWGDETSGGSISGDVYARAFAEAKASATLDFDPSGKIGFKTEVGARAGVSAGVSGTAELHSDNVGGAVSGGLHAGAIGAAGTVDAGVVDGEIKLKVGISLDLGIGFDTSISINWNAKQQLLELGDLLSGHHYATPAELKVLEAKQAEAITAAQAAYGDDKIDIVTLANLEVSAADRTSDAVQNNRYATDAHRSEAYIHASQAHGVLDQAKQLSASLADAISSGADPLTIAKLQAQEQWLRANIVVQGFGDVEQKQLADARGWGAQAELGAIYTEEARAQLASAAADHSDADTIAKLQSKLDSLELRHELLAKIAAYSLAQATHAEPLTIARAHLDLTTFKASHGGNDEVKAELAKAQSELDAAKQLASAKAELYAADGVDALTRAERLSAYEHARSAYLKLMDDTAGKALADLGVKAADAKVEWLKTAAAGGDAQAAAKQHVTYEQAELAYRQAEGAEAYVLAAVTARLDQAKQEDILAGATWRFNRAQQFEPENEVAEWRDWVGQLQSEHNLLTAKADFLEALAHHADPLTTATKQLELAKLEWAKANAQDPASADAQAAKVTLDRAGAQYHTVSTGVALGAAMAQGTGDLHLAKLSADFADAKLAQARLNGDVAGMKQGEEDVGKAQIGLALAQERSELAESADGDPLIVALKQVSVAQLERAFVAVHRLPSEKMAMADDDLYRAREAVRTALDGAVADAGGYETVLARNLFDGKERYERAADHLAQIFKDPRATEQERGKAEAEVAAASGTLAGLLATTQHIQSLAG